MFFPAWVTKWHLDFEKWFRPRTYRHPIIICKNINGEIEGVQTDIKYDVECCVIIKKIKKFEIRNVFVNTSKEF